MEIIKENTDLVNKLANNKIDTQYCPIIIELSGTPNSGKTTVLNKISSVCRRKHINCRVIFESAPYCKILNKLSPEFNYWTGADFIKKLWNFIAEKPDIVLCERGLFDAICWMEFHLNENNISKKQFQIMKNFYLNEDISNYTRYVLVMTCSDQVAVNRENTNSTYGAIGTIVNETTISKINIAIKSTIELCQNSFDKIDTIDTSDLNIEQTVDSVFNKILQYLNQSNHFFISEGQ